MCPVRSVTYVSGRSEPFFSPQEITTGHPKLIRPYSPHWLNGLPLELRIPILKGDFGVRMHNSGCEHVAWLSWSYLPDAPNAALKREGASAFLLDCGAGPFVVTAGHVYDSYMLRRNTNRRCESQLMNIGFDLDKRLITNGSNRNVDIATFHISAEEAAQLGKRTVIATGDWQAAPALRETCFLGGYPEVEAMVVGPREVNFGLHSAMMSVTSVVDYQLKFLMKREHLIDVRGHGLPRVGYNFSGMSGGPVLATTYNEQREEWGWRLAGVISQASSGGELLEMITAVRAYHIWPDGSIEFEPVDTPAGV
jgi:hypothetical protein